MQGIIEVIVRMFKEKLPAVFSKEMEVLVIAGIEQRPPVTGIYPARHRYDRVNSDNQVSKVQEPLREVPSHKTRGTGNQYLTHALRSAWRTGRLPQGHLAHRGFEIVCSILRPHIFPRRPKSAYELN